MSSNLVEHARRELALVEQGPDGDREFADSLLRAVEGFASYEGHSGGSAAVAIEWLGRLLRFENIAPLTDDPEEWMDVDGGSLWQNRRCASAFSKDAGKTYTMLDEPGRPVHTSARRS